MTLTLYMACNIYSFVFGLLESSKIILFLKDQVGKILEAKVAEKGLFLLFSVTSIISRIKYLNKVILDDSDRPNKTVQMNVLNSKYSIIVIKIFNVKITYVIYCKLNTSRHYGII